MKWIPNFFLQVKDLLRKGDITDSLFENLEEILLEADTGIQTAEFLVSQLKKDASEKRLKDSWKLMDCFKSQLIKLLGETPVPVHFAEKGLSVFLMVGVNGSGKTTTLGKLAAYFKAHGKKVFLGAADTFRAAAIDQLEVWAHRTGVEVIKHREGSDPGAVAYDTVKAAAARGADIAMIDTAGRLHTKTNLMEELKKIRKVMQKEIPEAPHETFLILDSTTGQNALMQSKIFKEAVDVTGIILTKLDGTAKGGVILAIRQELKIPIKFIGIGEKTDALQIFDPARFAESLLGENLKS
jgi:fused signal recognition particle receptor